PLGARVAELPRRSGRREGVTKSTFLDGIRSARIDLEHALARRDEQTLSASVIPGMTWTAKDVLAHLIGYDLAILAAIAETRAGRAWTWPWSAPDFDGWNESNVGPRRSRP